MTANVRGASWNRVCTGKEACLWTYCMTSVEASSIRVEWSDESWGSMDGSSVSGANKQIENTCNHVSGNE